MFISVDLFELDWLMMVIILLVWMLRWMLCSMVIILLLVGNLCCRLCRCSSGVVVFIGVLCLGC